MVIRLWFFWEVNSRSRAPFSICRFLGHWQDRDGRLHVQLVLVFICLRLYGDLFKILFDMLSGLAIAV